MSTENSENFERIPLKTEELFPSHGKYYEDDPKFRVMVLFSPETRDRFIKAVIKKYGTFASYQAKKALDEAVEMWIEEKLK